MGTQGASPRSVLQLGRAQMAGSAVSQGPGGNDLVLQVVTWQERPWPTSRHTWRALCAQGKLEGLL